MPEFLSRPLEWFRARPRTQQALIGAGVLIVLAAASQAVAVLAVLAFFVAAVAFVVQLVRRRPARGWMFTALGSLVAAVVFFALASAIYGPGEDRAEVDRAEEPAVEEELPRDQEQEPAQEQEREVPEYSVEQGDFRELGNGTIVIDLSLQTEATEEEEFRAIGQELKEEFRNEADALFVEASEVQMWVLIEERAEETYREGVVETPEYRDGVAVYPRE